MTSINSVRKHCVIIVLFLSVSGCRDGPEVADVEGTIKLDGAPLPEAFIQFYPAGGRPAYGKTDQNGWYEMYYTADTEGVKLGENIVKISTSDDAYHDEQGNLVPARPELVPRRYNTQSSDNPEMHVTVERGKNVFDFDLSSEGMQE